MSWRRRLPVLVAALAALGATARDPLPTGTGLRALPGAPPMPEDVRAAIVERLRDLPAGYEPRTRHLDEAGRPLYTNRLILESSPYLLQHAHNPVDWRPWGERAFAEARRLGRPVLLSVGYSTCHWCHVMERESFEDLEIARVLNELYVPIKVDREERPDVDAAYMTAVQLLTHEGGGWPMTVWLTPDAEPFFGATYMPPRDGDRGAEVGFLTQLLRARRVWDESRDEVEESGAEIAGLVRRALQAAGTESPSATGEASPKLADRIVAEYRRRFDSRFGGLRPAPKFPGGLSVRLLLRHHLRDGDERSLTIAVRTLEAMAAGGIHDQIGGGFHRYSTDPRWRLPHFEKMLYDNARLAIAYVEAWQATGRDDLAAVARDTLAYLDRETSTPEGAFRSATDADSPGPDGEPEEGRFFTWTRAEVDGVLEPGAAALVAAAYGLDDEEAELEGRHVLYAERSIGELASSLGRPEQEIRESLEAARERLYEARSRRPPPLSDDKVLTAWNALAVSAFVRAGVAFGDEELVDRGARAARFLLDRLRDEDGLHRIWRAGRASQSGFLEDHAFLEAALLDLFEATADPDWMRAALALQAALDERFAAPDGGYYRAPRDGEVVLARDKPFLDDALPSGNAVALQNLVRLHELTTDDRYRRRTDALVQAAAPFLRRAAVVAPELVVGIELETSHPREIVLVAASSRDELDPFLERLRRRYEPHKVMVAGTEAELTLSTDLVPFLEGKVARDGKATAYVCQQGACRLPVTDPDAFVAQLDAARQETH